jgi:hypothetical protein
MRRATVGSALRSRCRHLGQNILSASRTNFQKNQKIRPGVDATFDRDLPYSAVDPNQVICFPLGFYIS